MPDGNKEEDENDDDRNSDDEDELERQMGDLADDNKDVRAVVHPSVCVGKARGCSRASTPAVS